MLNARRQLADGELLATTHKSIEDVRPHLSAVFTAAQCYGMLKVSVSAGAPREMRRRLDAAHFLWRASECLPKFWVLPT